MTRRKCDTPRSQQVPRLLGDRLQKVTERTGIKDVTERVSAWLNIPCGCDERKEKLNQIHLWARRTLLGKVDNAEEYLERITEE